MATNARERKKKYVANAKAETGVSATAKYIRISIPIVFSHAPL